MMVKHVGMEVAFMKTVTTFYGLGICIYDTKEIIASGGISIHLKPMQS